MAAPSPTPSSTPWYGARDFPQRSSRRLPSTSCAREGRRGHEVPRLRHDRRVPFVWLAPYGHLRDTVTLDFQVTTTPSNAWAEAAGGCRGWKGPCTHARTADPHAASHMLVLREADEGAVGNDEPTAYDRNIGYQEVWAEPVRTVVAWYGISDIALAKTCRKLSCPAPRSGLLGAAKSRDGSGSTPRCRRSPTGSPA